VNQDTVAWFKIADEYHLSWQTLGGGITEMGCGMRTAQTFEAAKIMPLSYTGPEPMCLTCAQEWTILRLAQ
jgi:hypothetical protein